MFASIIDATCTSLPVYVTYRPSIREVRTIHHIIMTPRRQNYRSRSMILIVANYSPPSRPFLQVLQQVSVIKGASLDRRASVCLFIYFFFEPLFGWLIVFRCLSRINMHARTKLLNDITFCWHNILILYYLIFIVCWMIVEQFVTVLRFIKAKNKIARLRIYGILRCRNAFSTTLFERVSNFRI